MRQAIRRFWQATRAHPFRAALALAALLLLGGGGWWLSRHLLVRRHLGLAQQHLRRWDFRAAQNQLEECLRAGGRGDPELLLLAGQTARRAGDLRRAEQLFAQCKRRQGWSKPLSLERLLLDAQRGELRDVERTLLDMIAEDHPQRVLILEALAQGYILVYDIGRAITCLDRLLELEPDHVPALVWRARVREAVHRLQGALRDYRKAAELQPDNESATVELAELLARLTRFSEALGYWQKAYERWPRDARVLLGLARCRRNLSDTKEAVELLGRLLELQPDSAAGWAELGQAHFESGRIEEAEACLRRALRLAPRDQGATYTLALCLQHQEGKQKEAAQWLGHWKEYEADAGRKRELIKALKKAPGDPGLRQQLAVLFLRDGREEEALRWLTSALRVAPGHAPSHRTLAEIYERKGDHERAEWHRHMAQGISAP
jgi:tetratricopeptide (TPR) repeat protein